MSVASSWKLLASTTWIVSSVDSSTCALSAWPMLPPTSTRWPPASSIRPVSVVVVDLPLVPVIATMRPRSQRERARARRSPARPRGARASSAGWRERHARAQHDQIGAGAASPAVAAELELDAGRAQPVLVVELLAQRRVSVTVAPRRDEQLAPRRRRCAPHRRR